MTRSLLCLLATAAVLTAPAPAAAQADFGAFQSGAAGCPDLAADPDAGNLAALLCRPADRTSLDLPINQTGFKTWEVRAGSFHPFTRVSVTGAARTALGDAEFARLQSLLINAQVLSRSQDAYRIALLAEASEADAAGDSGLAAALRAEAAAVLGEADSSFDANIPELLAARADFDRLAFVRAGLLGALGGVDGVGHYEQAFGETLLATLAGLPLPPPGGTTVFTTENALNRVNPFFVGPDGVRDTADDLPYVANNERALLAGYVLGPPISGSDALDENRFDALFGRGTATDPFRPTYSKTAKLTVPSARTGAPKVVELYGVYSNEFLINQGCVSAGGIYDRPSGQCRQAGLDISDGALDLGCDTIIRTKGSRNLGRNADGDCIEVNTTAPTSAQARRAAIQFEVLALLGDLAARPLDAITEPADLTDFRAFADGGPNNTLPARPRASGPGNVSFPVAGAEFRRSTDNVSGAPLSAAGSECRIRENAAGEAIGPNGIPFDADDEFPSAGGCLLWSAPDAGGAQHLLSTDAVASTHAVNQSLFHTLCTVSFDADMGYCTFDRLNQGRNFGLIANLISGQGFLAAALLDGVETIQPRNADGSTSVSSRGSLAFISTSFLPIEPLALQDQSFQDLGVSLRSGQAALFGCGPAFASPCSVEQSAQWASSPAIVAGLTRDPVRGRSALGGVDLMSANASVVFQEFSVVKQRRRDALVGTAANGSGALYYLLGVNFSRTGQESMDVDAAFSRQGVQGPVPPVVGSIEPGAYLSLTPDDVLDLGAVGRAEYQIQADNLREADGWIEPMPWTVNQELLDRFGAIVFNADPTNPLDLDSPLNVWNRIDGGGAASYSNVDGEYCGRWMNSADVRVATPFNLGCTGLETVSANLERWLIAEEVMGQDRVFDPPESLAELMAMLDGDPSNDATGDPIAGPDGIFARNQYVFSDDEADFDVVAAPLWDPGSFGDYTIVRVPLASGDDPHVVGLDFLLAYEPQGSCPRPWCYLELNDVLVDPLDAKPQGKSLVLAMPIGFSVDVVTSADPSDPGSPVIDTGVDRLVNLARLQYLDLAGLRRLLAGQVVGIDTATGTETVRMSLTQRTALFGEFGVFSSRGRDIDGDLSPDLDRNRDTVWDGQDDHLPGPVSDDSVLCGSGIPGDRLQDGVQYSPYRADAAPDSDDFDRIYPDGFAPRSPVFCRSLNGLLALSGPIPGAPAGVGDAFLWHGGESAPGSDDDADGWPDVVDSCPSIANAEQADFDGDGVGDVCDNCAFFPNPRVERDYVFANPWAKTTGGQRDDDHDGYGNLCDGDFPGPSSGPAVATVSTVDVARFKASLGKWASGDDCGIDGTYPCAIFDLDGSGGPIDSEDARRLRELIGRPPGPTCAACPLECDSGTAASCD